MNISMMEAYTIEALKKDGYTYDTLIQAFDTNENEQVSSLKSLYEKDGELLKQAFNGRYKISFVTINGLKNLILMRFGIDPETYRIEHNGLFDIKMDVNIEKEIATFISSNWTMARQNDCVSFFVEGRQV